MEADVEGLVKPCIEAKLENPTKKTRYQIKQEEKRKNAELKHKQEMQKTFFAMGFLVVMMVFLFVMIMLEG